MGWSVDLMPHLAIRISASQVPTSGLGNLRQTANEDAPQRVAWNVICRWSTKEGR